MPNAQRRTKPSYAKYLTPDWANGRWKKYYRGVQRYFRHPLTRDGYQHALEEWQALKAEVDRTAEADKPHRAQYEAAIKLRQELMQFCLLELRNPPESVDREEAALLRMLRLGDDVNPARVPPDAPPADPELHAAMGEAFDAIDAAERAQVVAYLDEVRATYQRAQKEIEQLRSLFQRVKPPALDAPDTLPILPHVPFPDWIERLASFHDFQRWTGTTDHADTISGNIDTYLNQERLRVEAGDIVAATYKATRERIEHFRSFAGARAVAQLEGRTGAKTLDDFTEGLKRRIADGETSAQTAKHQLAQAKAFVRWLYRREVIERLPRNLDDLEITVRPKGIETWTRDEIDQILGNASDRTRLYVLLMLNCGFYQSDIAGLRQAECDVKAGRITRKRTKTADHENVPLVCWILWDETLRLLSQELSDHAQLALTNANGGPLRLDTVKADGSVKQTDNIKSAYDRVCRKLEVPGKPLMLLRKTAATKLGEHAEFRAYAQYFLDQAPETLADERYVRPSQEAFDRAVIWLGEQFGFATDPARVKV